VLARFGEITQPEPRAEPVGEEEPVGMSGD
jgi:hypothetical protein